MSFLRPLQQQLLQQQQQLLWQQQARLRREEEPEVYAHHAPQTSWVPTTRLASSPLRSGFASASHSREEVPLTSASLSRRRRENGVAIESAGSPRSHVLREGVFLASSEQQQQQQESLCFLRGAPDPMAGLGPSVPLIVATPVKSKTRRRQAVSSSSCQTALRSGGVLAGRDVSAAAGLGGEARTGTRASSLVQNAAGDPLRLASDRQAAEASIFPLSSQSALCDIRVGAKGWSTWRQAIDWTLGVEPDAALLAESILNPKKSPPPSAEEDCEAPKRLDDGLGGDSGGSVPAVAGLALDGARGEALFEDPAPSSTRSAHPGNLQGSKGPPPFEESCAEEESSALRELRRLLREGSPSRRRRLQLLSNFVEAMTPPRNLAPSRPNAPSASPTSLRGGDRVSRRSSSSLLRQGGVLHESSLTRRSHRSLMLRVPPPSPSSALRETSSDEEGPRSGDASRVSPRGKALASPEVEESPAALAAAAAREVAEAVRRRAERGFSKIADTQGRTARLQSEGLEEVEMTMAPALGIAAQAPLAEVSRQPRPPLAASLSATPRWGEGLKRSAEVANPRSALRGSRPRRWGGRDLPLAEEGAELDDEETSSRRSLSDSEAAAVVAAESRLRRVGGREPWRAASAGGATSVQRSMRARFNLGGGEAAAGSAGGVSVKAAAPLQPLTSRRSLVPQAGGAQTLSSVPSLELPFRNTAGPSRSSRTNLATATRGRRARRLSVSSTERSLRQTRPAQEASTAAVEIIEKARRRGTGEGGSAPWLQSGEEESRGRRTSAEAVDDRRRGSSSSSEALLPSLTEAAAGVASASALPRIVPLIEEENLLDPRGVSEAAPARGASPARSEISLGFREASVEDRGDWVGEAEAVFDEGFSVVHDEGQGDSCAPQDAREAALSNATKDADAREQEGFLHDEASSPRESAAANPASPEASPEARAKDASGGLSLASPRPRAADCDGEQQLALCDDPSLLKETPLANRPNEREASLEQTPPQTPERRRQATTDSAGRTTALLLRSPVTSVQRGIQTSPDKRRAALTRAASVKRGPLLRTELSTERRLEEGALSSSEGTAIARGGRRYPQRVRVAPTLFWLGEKVDYDFSGMVEVVRCKNTLDLFLKQHDVGALSEEVLQSRNPAAALRKQQLRLRRRQRQQRLLTKALLHKDAPVASALVSKADSADASDALQDGAAAEASARPRLIRKKDAAAPERSARAALSKDSAAQTAASSSAGKRSKRTQRAGVSLGDSKRQRLAGSRRKARLSGEGSAKGARGAAEAKKRLPQRVRRVDSSDEASFSDNKDKDASERDPAGLFDEEGEAGAEAGCIDGESSLGRRETNMASQSSQPLRQTRESLSSEGASNVETENARRIRNAETTGLNEASAEDSPEEGWNEVGGDNAMLFGATIAGGPLSLFVNGAAYPLEVGSYFTVKPGETWALRNYGSPDDYAEVYVCCIVG